MGGKQCPIRDEVLRQEQEFEDWDGDPYYEGAEEGGTSYVKQKGARGGESQRQQYNGGSRKGERNGALKGFRAR